MAFDVEGARKAGYTDAEIAGHLAKTASFDLSAAKSAGYSDGEVIAHLMTKAANTAQIPVDPRVKAPPAQRQPSGPQSLADKAIGAGEAALTTVTGATGGAMGMLAGTLQGLAEQILSGQFGTQQAAGMVEKRAAEGAQALTYQPRTETGQDYAETVGKAMQQLVPVAGVAPALAVPGAARPPVPARVAARAGAEGVARDVATTAARAVDAVAPGAVDAQAAGQAAAATVARTADRLGTLAQGATTLPRRALEAARRQPDAEPTPGTLGSVGAAGTDMATQRRTNAAALGFTGDAALTKGQATRDPAQLKFEVETAKLSDAGQPLRQRAVAQNEQILANFDHWADQTGAQAPDLRAVGVAVDRALVEQAKRDKVQIRAAYKAAEKAGEMADPVTLQSAIAHINEAMPDADMAPIISAARKRALRYGIAVEGADGELIPQPTTLNVAERFRQSIGDAVDYQRQNVRHATIIKGLLDEATDGLGGNLYRDARALRARFAQNYEDRAVISKLLNTKRGTSDRAVAFEDVFDHTVKKGSLDDLRNVRRVLQRSGDDGAQAWRELQGQTVRWIRDEATKNVATDSAGRRVVSAAGLDKAVRTLDADGRLDFLLGKRGAQQVRDINELAKYVKTVPPEAATNTSNTVSALLGAFGDVGLSGVAGAPVPVVTMTRVVRQYVKDRALRKRIEDALADVERRQAPGRNRNTPPLQAPSRSGSVH